MKCIFAVAIKWNRDNIPIYCDFYWLFKYKNSIFASKSQLVVIMDELGNIIKERRKASVYYNGILSGELIEISGKEYLFRYNDNYFTDATQPAISLTLPKTRQEYRSGYLFPFFFNMLSEGSNRATQSRLLRIDEKDHFGILLATAQQDTIGAITVKPIVQ